MNIKTTIALDRALGILVAYPLNILVRIVGKLTRFDHSLKKEMQKIVVCKFKGMGSIIQSTPLLQALRSRYPNATIVYVSSIENKGILEKIDIVDQCLFVNDKRFFPFIGSTFKLVTHLMRFRADVYIDLEIYSNFSSIITTTSLARDRFGYYLRSNRYRMGMYTHMMYFNTKAPIAEAYLQFARLLGITEPSSQLISIPKNENATFQFEGKYITINVNASDLRYERRWPHSHFIELIQKIRQQSPKLNIVLIGSSGESDYVKTVSAPFFSDEKVKDVSGKTNLAQLIELLRATDLLITNDTGPMHLASSLKTDVLALFGPCSPQQYGFGANVKTIYKNAYCSPCVHEFVVPPCKGDNQCMKLISVDEVFEAFLDYENFVSFTPIQFNSSPNQTLGTVKR